MIVPPADSDEFRFLIIACPHAKVLPKDYSQKKVSIKIFPSAKARFPLDGMRTNTHAF
jgi:hypothetical protein